MGWQQLAWRLLTPSGLPATGLSLPVVRKVCLDAAAVSMLLVGKAVADPFGDCQQHGEVIAELEKVLSWYLKSLSSTSGRS